MKKIFIILLILVAGAAGYLIANNDKGVETTQTPTTEGQPTTGAPTYTDEELGFMVTLPESMRGYTVTHTHTADGQFQTEAESFEFRIPNDNDPIGSIVAVPLRKWATGWPCLYGGEPCSPAREITRNIRYVFATEGYGSYGGRCGVGNENPSSPYCTAVADLRLLPKANFAFPK